MDSLERADTGALVRCCLRGPPPDTLTHVGVPSEWEKCWEKQLNTELDFILYQPLYFPHCVEATGICLESKIAIAFFLGNKH